MNGVLTGAALAVTLLLGVGLFAVWRGPTVFDRLVAVAQIASGTLVLLVLFGFVSGRPELYLDVALTYALLAVILPIALSAYVDRTAVDDHREEVDDDRNEVDDDREEVDDHRNEVDDHRADVGNDEEERP